MAVVCLLLGDSIVAGGGRVVAPGSVVRGPALVTAAYLLVKRQTLTALFDSTLIELVNGYVSSSGYSVAPLTVKTLAPKVLLASG